MTKLELTVSADSFECLSLSDQTAQVLGVQTGVNVASVLANEKEFKQLESAIQKLQASSPPGGGSSFQTLNLVFSAPHAPTVAPVADRSPLQQACFRSPIQPIHTAGELHLSCFVHLQLRQDDEDNNTIHVTALEYAREHRQNLLQQEFGSWLLEEHIESAVIATDLLGNIIYWNGFAKKLYQWEKEEVMGKCIMEVTPSKMTQELAGEIFGKLAQGEHWKGLFEVQKRDGTEIMAYVIDTPVVDAEGALKFIVGISSDHTQVHNLMEELKTLNTNLEQEVVSRTQELLEREDALRMVGAAIQASDTGVIITEEDHKIVWSSNAVFSMLGQSEQEVLGSLPWDLNLHREVNDDCPESDMTSFFSSGGASRITAYAVRETASDPAGQLHLSVRIQVLPGTKQNMIILRDITAQRKADEALVAAERAIAASESKTEMMQMLSHEFRTPLQGITGVASTMLVDMTAGDGQHFDNISTILASSRLLLTLIGNVLDLGKLEAGKMQEIELRTVNVANSVKDTLKFCDPFAALNEVELIFENQNGTDDYTMKADRLRLQQILINLVSNGIKYTEQGTSLVLSIRQCRMAEAIAEACSAGASDISYFGGMQNGVADDKLAVVVSIRDHGGGIPQEEFSSLFGRFVQLEVSKEKDRKSNGCTGNLVDQSPSGTGLGLNLVLQFVARMNGHVWVNNAESGRGAVFSFCLPRGDPILVEDDSTRDSKKYGNLELSREDAASFRVLLVDDSLINLKVLGRMLTRLGVKGITTSINGCRALEVLNSIENPKHYPNLIISDLQMPEMDGFELMSRLRDYNWQGGESPVIVACSADWSSETEHLCLNSGFDRMLRKPVAFAEFKHFLADAANDVVGLSNESNGSLCVP